MSFFLLLPASLPLLLVLISLACPCGLTLPHSFASPHSPPLRVRVAHVSFSLVSDPSHTITQASPPSYLPQQAPSTPANIPNPLASSPSYQRDKDYREVERAFDLLEAEEVSFVQEVFAMAFRKRLLNPVVSLPAPLARGTETDRRGCCGGAEDSHPAHVAYR